MIDQRPTDTTDIDQAPSPADVAAADERVGRVDFTRRLGQRRPRELREDRGVPDLADSADVADAAEVSDASDGSGRWDGGATVPRGRTGTDDPHLVILPPARVEEILAAEEAKLEATATEAPETSAAPAVPTLQPDRTPDLDVGQSVEDVAAAIISSMRAIEENHHRHLEALETEATRRYELLLAQAELDAELIRLNGRREAHRIIANARARTGAARGDAPRESTRLQEIGETFTRFAETIESGTTAPPPDPGTT